jgi:DNA polymerase III sliding clamp (beta) subunit (PCNA family)
MPVNSSILRKSLQKLGPLTQGKHIPILSCVRLQSGSDSLSLHASNTEQYMRIKVPYAGNHVSCCVSHKRLASLPCEGEVALECGDDQMTVKADSFKAKLSTLPASEWPEIKPLESDGIEIPPGLGNMIRWCSKAAMDSQAPADAPFLGLYISGDSIIATDRKRFHFCTVDGLNLPTLRIPSECIETFASMVEDGCILKHNERALELTNDDTLFQTRMLADAYCNAGPVIAKHGAGEAWGFDAREMIDGINRCKAIWGELFDKRVSIQASEETITISAINGKETMSSVINGSGVGMFEWNGTMLTDLLSGFIGPLTLNLNGPVISVATEQAEGDVPWSEDDGGLKLSCKALAFTFKVSAP